MNQQTLKDGRVRCPICKQFRYPEDTAEIDTDRYPKYAKYRGIKMCVGCLEYAVDKMDGYR